MPVEVVVADPDAHARLLLAVLAQRDAPLETPLPVRAGITTFIAFMVAGFVPLVALWAFGSAGFLASTIATAATFFTVGLIKARVLGGGMLASGFETLLVGSGAAVLAYSVAALTKGLVG